MAAPLGGSSEEEDNFMKTYDPVHTLLGSPRALEGVLQVRLLEIKLLVENLPLSRKEVIYLH